MDIEYVLFHFLINSVQTIRVSVDELNLNKQTNENNLIIR